MIGERLADEANRPRIEVRQRAPELLPHAIAGQAGFPETCHEFPASGVDGSRRFVMMSRIERRRPSARLIGNRSMRGLEERQRQQLAVIAGNGSHRPTNSGVPRAAKASKARLKSSVFMQIAWACASASMA